MNNLDRAYKHVEFQINKEEKVEIDEQDAQNTPFEEGEVVRDNIDCDHRETLEEAKDHFFLEEDHWSIEKVERYTINGDEVKREHTLIEESG
jgi:hypothetical protein